MEKSNTTTSLPGTDRQAGTASFGAAALGMSWQLALVVLLPILGGYKLDQAAGSMPWLTLLGLMLALAGSVIVIRRSLQAFGNFNVPTPADKPDNTNAGVTKEKTL